ncbi:PPE domain-containing protein [Nocardia thailandica]|uniref:PPE domain-containing protein n=1 Tax=Nocardia thailandica TaxID=257275 RepID=UPI0002D30294|nr:PPE domain-containing protein [Nocardia thailandica]
MGFLDWGEDVGEFFVDVGTLGGWKVFKNYNASREADGNRATLDEQGKQTWQGDRDIITSEFSRLAAGAGLTMDGKAVTAPEEFSTWTHQQIWEALNGKDGQAGVSAGEVNAGADAWRRLTTGTQAAVDNYRTSFERVLSEKWSGTSGTAAIEAIKSYTTEAGKLPTAFQLVANGIDHMEGLLGQAKIAIPKPEEVSSFDEFVGHIPGNGVVKAAKHRANEAQADAQLFMIGTYQPGSTTVDSHTPVLPVPQNTVSSPSTGPGDGNNGDGTGNGNGNGSNNSGVPSTAPAGTGENPAATTPQSTDTTDDPSDDDTDTGDTDTNPSSTDPSSTTPAATTPDTTGTPNTPGDNKTGGPPGAGSPGSGTPGAGVPGAGTPGAGRSVAAAPGAAGAAGAGARTGAGASGARGMSGMPGMMGGGRGAGGKDDENEHKTPDYLVQDRETELIGKLPPTLPAGGVIGG